MPWGRPWKRQKEKKPFPDAKAFSSRHPIPPLLPVNILRVMYTGCFQLLYLPLSLWCLQLGFQVNKASETGLVSTTSMWTNLAGPFMSVSFTSLHYWSPCSNQSCLGLCCATYFEPILLFIFAGFCSSWVKLQRKGTWYMLIAPHLVSSSASYLMHELGWISLLSLSF